MTRRDDRLRIIVTGLAAEFPLGGVAWDYLQYVIGFARLGHDVYYHEDTGLWPYDPVHSTVTNDGTTSAQYLRDFFARYAPELGSHWHYRHLRDTDYGMTAEEFDRVARSTDVFLNVSGTNFVPDVLSDRCVTVFLDTDPGFNQLNYVQRYAWSKNVEEWCALVDRHRVHATYAENIHAADCEVPRLGFDWVTTRMPIVTDLWPEVPVHERAPWTTVMTWNAFVGPVVWNGREYRSKDVEFATKILDLPRRARARFLAAVGGRAPRAELRNAGWEVVDAPRVTATPAMYQQLLARARGEIGVAKNVYVDLRTGWFSTRSACFLAAGRPVVVQDTGFVSELPTGDAVFPFADGADAAAAVDKASTDCVRASAAAREVARTHFGADTVLTRLLDDVHARV